MAFGVFSVLLEARDRMSATMSRRGPLVLKMASFFDPDIVFNETVASTPVSATACRL